MIESMNTNTREVSGPLVDPAFVEVTAGRAVAVVDGAAAADTPEASPTSSTSRGTPRTHKVSLVRADHVKPAAVRWIWKGWLAAGKFHVLAGQPGTGKTTIALALAAVMSSGARWPDDSQATPANVLIWSGEDDPADTLVPRLLAMGAALERVHFVDGVMEGAERRSFDPARDMGALERQVATIGGAGLLIVDPVVSAVSGDSHKNAETRKALQPLVDLGARAGCAVLGITHLTKGTSGREPIERITGSLAFGALARIVLVAATLPEGVDEWPGGRVLTRVKSNVGIDTGGFSYDMQEVDLPQHPGVRAPRVVWRGAIHGTARELLAVAEPHAESAQDERGDQSMTVEAIELLRAALACGPMLSRDVKTLAADAGISPKALRSARERLEVEDEREGYGKDTKTYWMLPGTSLVPSGLNSAQSLSGAQLNLEGTTASLDSDRSRNPDGDIADGR